MASDLQNKSIQTDGAETQSIAKQNPNEILAASKSSPFTTGRQQILGDVYQLSLGWRRELSHAAPVPRFAEREA